MIETWFDGAMWAARKAGFPGVVFGETEGEARNRALTWFWNHSPKVIEHEPRPRKRKN